MFFTEKMMKEMATGTTYAQPVTNTHYLSHSITMKQLSFITLLVLATLGTSLRSHAQEGIKIGLMFSPSISWSNITDADQNDVPGLDPSTRVGYAYGLSVDYFFKEAYAFHTGVQIVNKGYQASFTDRTEDVRFTSVEIPLGLKLRTNEFDNGMRINAVFGLSLDFYVGYKNEYEGQNPISGVTGNGTTRNNDIVNPLGVTFILGPGVEFSPGGEGIISIAVTYHNGLNNVNNRSNAINDFRILLNYTALDLVYYF